MTARPTAEHHLHRRTFAGIAAVGLGAPLLAACSGGASGGVATDPNTPGSSPTRSASGDPQGSPTDGADAFTQTSDIEVGGGTIFPNDQVVITQPTQGQFKCFSAVCTHQGCIVSSVAGGNINCACHGSAFSIADGSVVSGPATQPLAEEAITVQGHAITLG